MAQAMSGVMSVTGYPGGPPVKAGVPVADIGCALFAIYAMLAAYIGAKATGAGPVRRCVAVRFGAGVLGVGHLRILGHGQASPSRWAPPTR